MALEKVSRRGESRRLGGSDGRRRPRVRPRTVGGAPHPVVRLRAFRAADAPVIRRWEGPPEPFLRVIDVIESARVPGTTTSVAVDPVGRIVAVFQAAPEDDGRRSVALLVHPGRRGAGFGKASLLAALDERCYAGSVLRAVIDRDNVASLRCFAACGFLDDDDAPSAKYAQLMYRVPQGAASNVCKCTSAGR